MGSTRQTPNSLDEWARYLTDREMPIFSHTANSIYASLDDKHKGAMELASIILQDPNLTAKLLKLSNSSYYNPSRQKINTISRAIVILGANTIRELTLACAFFESILSPDNKEHANREIGDAIHAAVQAKELAVMTNDPSPEEIFIATLLHNIGNIAFWCFDHQHGKRINELLSTGQYTANEAEKKVLGFTLRRLSKQLSHAWNLGGLTEQAINTPRTNNPRVALVNLGHQICQATKSKPPQTALQECLGELHRLTGLEETQLTDRINQNTHKAVKIAIQFGAHDASKYIAGHAEESPPKEKDPEATADPRQLQIDILQEISTHISGPINLNILFEMVLEGIHRGVGMDRTLFLLLSADKKTLHEKSSFGWSKSPDSDDKITLADYGTNLMFHCIKNGKSLWAKPRIHYDLYDSQINRFIGANDCFVMPLQTERKIIGLIYCDRAIQHHPLSQDEFNACKHFAKQANIGLALYRMRSLASHD